MKPTTRSFEFGAQLVGKNSSHHQFHPAESQPASIRGLQTVQRVFLDANSYLGFYSLSPKDIEELGKVVELIELKKLTILLPGQVVDEVRRNRAKVIADRIKTLQEARLQMAVPQMLLGTDGANELRRAAAVVHKLHSELLDEMRTSARYETLPADLLIARLFKKSLRVADPDAIAKAGQRKALGKPPGKGSSLGDAVNWEVLLSTVPKNSDVCFVSADGDFSSPLDSESMDEYLVDEWKQLKNSQIRYHRDIKQFLDSVFPQIRLASDVRKYFLIGSLIESTSFADSHGIVASLNQYESFTAEEARRLLSGGMENSQVRWLAQDEDVAALLAKVLAPHRADLPKPLVDRWDYVASNRGLPYGPVPTDDDLVRPAPVLQDDPLF